MPGRTSLKKGLTQTSKEEGGSTTRTTAQIEKYYSGGKRPFSYKKNDRGKIVKIPQMLTGGQAAIAAKAPPPNKIDAKDFAVLRAEKAKGRGMGLQDEKVQPGKVMKAKMGVATDYKKYLKGLKKATDSVKKDKENKFLKRRMQLMGMPKLSKGGGADSGRIGEMKSRLAVAQDKLAGGFRKARGKVSPRDYDKITERTKTYALAQSMKDKDRLTDRDIKKASSLVKGKMGGGMMQKPMGYSKGVSVKARGCKLGRTKPTKIT